MGRGSCYLCIIVVRKLDIMVVRNTHRSYITHECKGLQWSFRTQNVHVRLESNNLKSSKLELTKENNGENVVPLQECGKYPVLWCLTRTICTANCKEWMVLRLRGCRG